MGCKYRFRIGRRLTMALALLVFLSGCSMGEPPFHITRLSFASTPSVGQVTDLVVEVVNDMDKDADLVRVQVYVPEGVHLINDGSLVSDPTNTDVFFLETSLKARVKGTYRFPLCVTSEGEHRITAGAWEVISEQSVLGESESINVTNYGNKNRVVRGHDYRYTPFPRGYLTPTPLPVTLSPDCLGEGTAAGSGDGP